MRSSLRKDKVKVCILTSAHSVFGLRVFHKEAKTLARAGYDVTLVAQHNKNEIVDGVRIIGLPKPKSRLLRMVGTVWKTYVMARKQKADVYHFHDPELILVGVVLRLFGNKVVYDVHEDVPKQILNKDWVGNVYVRKFVAFITNIIEQAGAFLFDGIVAATPDIGGKFPESKTIVLRNLPILELIDKAKPVDLEKDKPIIIYTSGLSRIRGVGEVIQSMEFVRDKAKLWLLGVWESEEFRKDCESLEGWKYTKYLGFVPLSKVYEYMKVADIGISILYPIENYITSLPVKAFEYMACSLPMVMSDFSYWQEIFGECALFANPYEPNDIADRILYLLDNADKAKQLGKRGKQLTEEKYNWEAEQGKLLDIYDRILDNTQND